MNVDIWSRSLINSACGWQVVVCYAVCDSHWTWSWLGLSFISWPWLQHWKLVTRTSVTKLATVFHSWSWFHHIRSRNCVSLWINCSRKLWTRGAVFVQPVKCDWKEEKCRWLVAGCLFGMHAQRISHQTKHSPPSFHHQKTTVSTFCLSEEIDSLRFMA